MYTVPRSLTTSGLGNNDHREWLHTNDAMTLCLVFEIRSVDLSCNVKSQ